jgi:transcriptional regulator with XRE-family HTH domain
MSRLPTPPATLTPADHQALAQRVGQTVRSLRTQAGLSQAKLAILSGLNPSTIVRLETGRTLPHLRQLQAIAHGLQRPLTITIPASEATPEREWWQLG